MSLCPYCDRKIDAEAIACPHCREPLKAFGHPGIPLYQSTDRSYLCDRCLYHQDDTCTYPQRPFAKTCILFHDLEQPKFAPPTAYKTPPLSQLKNLGYRHRRELIIVVILLAAFIFALTR